MELRLALDLIQAVFAEGRRLEACPLSAIVLDSGGNTVACAREDGAGIARLKLAYSKAWGSLGLGIGSRTLADRVGASPPFFSAAASLLDGRLLPAPGGILLLKQEITIGALGVSGDTGDTDEACAIAATAAVGLAHRA